MIELPLAYWHQLADQIIFISSLLSGFSLAVIIALLGFKPMEGVASHLLKAATIAAASFIVTIFAMTKVMMMTTEGYPFEVSDKLLMMPRTLGSISFFMGIIALISIIALAGWVKSKKLGWFTTIVAVLAFVLIFIMLS